MLATIVYSDQTAADAQANLSLFWSNISQGH